MSKKKKKKKFRAQLAQAIKNIDQKDLINLKSNQEIKKPQKQEKDIEDVSETDYIKSDIKKIVFATSICLALLLIVFYFNQSTDIVKNFSEKLVNGLNI